ncbi:MAG: hypothetical protein HN919_20010 [Verrucomicrobia bacterium]|jgi:hypothetical protein|nr:hypothetical protein [Verrucomicrobiota bacterium]MBT7068591.1 hypothetical protein [Verrucomicrobiota bacterium]MBT7698745.1 hypothetical protein [Verrucomicrobiota bacterium]
MSSQLFGLWGYLSILLWLIVPALWVLHHIRRPRRWLCHVAVLVAVLAWLFAVINSATYVNRIQIDRSEEIAAAQARQEAARKLAEESRAGDVAQKRFAEDDASDYLDTAGMDEADLKYMTSFDDDATPEWKKEKRTRSSTPKEDDSLEAMLDTSTGEEKGVDSELIEAAAAEPIMMPEKDYMMANRLDGWNLKLVRWLILVALAVVVTDYLKRANCYAEAYLPLPLPSGWINSQTPLAGARSLPATPRRGMPQELAWLSHRGETFVYLAADRNAAATIPERLPRLPLGLCKTDVLHVSDAQPIDPDFIFETLWYGRSSFVVDSTARAEALVTRMLELLQERKTSRAHTRQNVHVVWELPAPPAEEIVAEFERLGGATGVVLVVKG